VGSEPVMSDPAGPHRPGRRDAVRNYHRVLEAAREVLGESGADASMEEIAARAGVGVGTVYRRFANKDALIDELPHTSSTRTCCSSGASTAPSRARSGPRSRS
jgi:DNA-binding transcriptional regulator YbjK